MRECRIRRHRVAGDLWHNLRMATSPSAPISERDASPDVSEKRERDPALLARLVVREGKPFVTSAVEAGYSLSVGRNGLKKLMSESAAVAEAVKAEWERLNVGLDKLKPLAVQRLYREIIDNESPYGMKAIELAGRFKETDWFVRNQDLQLGVFVNLADSAPETKDLDTFKE